MKCTFIPKKGSKLFNKLRKEFGYEDARNMFIKIVGDDFKNKYKDTLVLDDESIPTYESVMSNVAVQNTIGKNKLEDAAIGTEPISNTYTGFTEAVEKANTFNSEHPARNNYIAVVNQLEDRLKVELLPKTEHNIKLFSEQKAAIDLNSKLIDILAPLGLSIGMLSDAEVGAGRIGVTDFSVVRDIASNFSNVIKIANNLEGTMALSEEVSHLIIGMFKKHNLVERGLTTLTKNPKIIKEILGSEYDKVFEFYDGNLDKIAEEALGKVLQNNLLKESNTEAMKSIPLFSRILNYIKNLFRSINPYSIDEAIIEVNDSMGRFAKQILNKQLEISKETLKNSYREEVFNSLSSTIDTNIEVLKNAAKTEIKRLKIMEHSHNKDADDIKQQKENVDNILKSVTEGGDPLLGFFNYSKSVLDSLKYSANSLSNINKIADSNVKFKILRAARSHVYSYGPFIDAASKMIKEAENNDDQEFLKTIVIDDTPINVKDIIEKLDHYTKEIGRLYSKHAFSLFAEFLEPFVDEDIKKAYKEYAGTDLSVEEMLKKANSDISLMDAWLDSMANSSDIILQLFDRVAKKSYDNARLETIDFIKRSEMLRIKAEKLGIKSFDWVIERDSDGNLGRRYISKINYAQFEKERADKIKELNDKYGEVATGENAINKQKELSEWRKKHCAFGFLNHEPNPELYRNKVYENLSTAELEILNEYLKLKKELDSLIGNDNEKVIQIRKSLSDRISSSTNPREVWENIKEGFKSSFLDKEDDQDLFGDKTTKSIVDFTGKEFMIVPAIGVPFLENPNEVSTDIFRSLNMYAYSAILKNHIEKIIDPMEVGRTIVEEDRDVLKRTRAQEIVEKLKYGNVTAVNKVSVKGGENIKTKLDAFFDSRIYLRYLKDHGNIGSSNININKTVGTILNASSLAKLGFNYLSNISNALNGIAMTNIEAAAQQFFKAKDLLNADKEYSSLIGGLLKDNATMQRNKTNKLSLFSELFNIKQDFDTDIRDVKDAKLIKRIFGDNIAMLVQTGGDHWLYHRIAIAMCMNEKVVVPKKGEMSLWEALEIVDMEGGVKKMILPEGTKNLKGEFFNLFAFQNKIHEVNHTLFGIYNSEDKTTAHRVAVGRILLQYRNWMKALYSRRFRTSYFSTNLGEMEGFYITLFNLVKDSIKGKQNIIETYHQLSDTQKANIKRAGTELLQFIAVWALCTFGFKSDGDDDEENPWYLKTAEYFSRRMLHELGTLTPSHVFVQENLKTIDNPIPIAPVLDDIGKLAISIVYPPYWFEEMEKGPHKGMTVLEKNLYSAPIPIVNWYRNVDRFLNDVDKSMQFYSGAYR